MAGSGSFRNRARCNDPAGALVFRGSAPACFDENMDAAVDGVVVRHRTDVDSDQTQTASEWSRAQEQGVAIAGEKQTLDFRPVASRSTYH
jgi:hypothetical protein